MSAEHDDAVAAAREHLADGPDPARPLGPLPADFAATRAALHLVAEQLLKPKRELETGNEIALGFTPGGFGTPIWDRGVASGASGQARVDGEAVSTGERFFLPRLLFVGQLIDSLQRANAPKETSTRRRRSGTRSLGSSCATSACAPLTTQA